MGFRNHKDTKDQWEIILYQDVHDLPVITQGQSLVAAPTIYKTFQWGSG